MTTQQQKETERFYVKRYLAFAGFSGEIIDRERPDFAVVGADRIGVEVTEYHQPAHDGDRFSRTAVEGAWKKLQADVVAYRKSHADLEQLYVHLMFRGLLLPPHRDNGSFIEEVHKAISDARPRLGRQVTRIAIGDQHPSVLRTYLSAIEVHVLNAYAEWSWDKAVAWVGTNDDELLAIIAPKLKLQRPPDFDQLHLVLAGGGRSLGNFIGHLHADELRNWPSVNRALEASDFEAMGILNYEGAAIWGRTRGWRTVTHAEATSQVS